MTDSAQPPAGYAAALDELHTILEELEDEAVDVDVLAAKVERAAELLRFCRSRIDQAQMQVETIVAELEDLEGVETPAPDTSAS
jgi:exodeoxyribonuclease VII small subunit